MKGEAKSQRKRFTRNSYFTFTQLRITWVLFMNFSAHRVHWKKELQFTSWDSAISEVVSWLQGALVSFYWHRYPHPELGRVLWRNVLRYGVLRVRSYIVNLQNTSHAPASQAGWCTALGQSTEGGTLTGFTVQSSVRACYSRRSWMSFGRGYLKLKFFCALTEK